MQPLLKERVNIPLHNLEMRPRADHGPRPNNQEIGTRGHQLSTKAPGKLPVRHRFRHLHLIVRLARRR